MRTLVKTRSGAPPFKRFVRTGLVAARTLIKRNEAKGITFPDKQGAARSGVKALLTTAIAGVNNDLTFRAKKNGTYYNGIRVAYVVAGNNTPLSIVVAGLDITVNLSTSGVGAATTLASTLRDAINGNPNANILVSAELAAGNDGTGTLAALGLTNLAGGVDGPDTVIRGAGQFEGAASGAREIRQRPATPPRFSSQRGKTVTKALPGVLRKR